MPTLIRLCLLPQEDTLLRLEKAPAQGWFLTLAAQIDPAWAIALHPPEPTSSMPPSPPSLYSLSPLYHASDSSLEEDDQIGTRMLASGRIRRGSPLALRIGLADDQRAHELLRALPRLIAALPLLGFVPCRLLRCPLPHTFDPDVLSVTPEQLAHAPSSHRLRLDFTTPTAFRSQGDYLLLPEPARLWQGWQQTWLRLTGTLPAPLAGMPVFPRIAAYELQTRSVPLKGGLFLGFTGWMELSWPREVPEADRRAATALAGIADFFGTGAKTALGMGQTRLRVLSHDAA